MCEFASTFIEVVMLISEIWKLLFYYYFDHLDYFLILSINIYTRIHIPMLISCDYSYNKNK